MTSPTWCDGFPGLTTHPFPEKVFVALGYNCDMPILDLEKLQVHRTGTFNLPPISPITTPAGALKFIKARGYAFFWPIKGIEFPSLWSAVAGDRPVPNEHDDPGHITWGWKDDALDKRQWYYAKVLRGKATFISLDIAPFFYALSENYGSPEEDYLIAYEEGRLTQAAKQVYEAILKNGPLNTIDLRSMAHLVNAKDSEFNRALEVLQRDFKILPVGVAQAGSWRYAFIYESTARYYPELPDQARTIGEAQARERILELYFAALGGSSLRQVKLVFGWGSELIGRTLERLQAAGSLVPVAHPNQPGDWYALPGLV
jgi:hypothetical protein